MKKLTVIGLGYVGLPLTLRLSQLNYRVVAIDIDAEKIKSLIKKKLPFAQNEPHFKNYLKRETKRKTITFSSSFEDIKNSQVIFVCVDTPIYDKKPNYKSLTAALGSTAKFLRRNSIVVVESTVSPKTCVNLVIPTLEKGSNLKINKDFFVAAVPERIRPNHIFEQLTTLPRVIGISDEKIKHEMKKFYQDITSGALDFVDLTTAETVKTVENTFRDVNIAFANQMALACEELGVNIWKVRELVNKSPFHDLHKPSPGVGGHCIPKDPWLLLSSVGTEHLSIVKDARKTNDSMPAHLLELIKITLREENINPKKAKVCVLGYSYVEDSDDVRNSPSQMLLDLLKLCKIKYTIHDPNVEGLNTNLLGKIKDADCIVLTVGHKEYKHLSLKKLSKLVKNKILVDGKNYFDKSLAQKHGFIYKGIGNL